MKNYLNFFYILGLLCFMTACQQSGTSEATAEEAKGEQAKPDIERIISLSGLLTEVLYELGHLDKIVGRDITSTYPSEMQEITSLGHVSQLNTEGIISLNPQLIFVEDQQIKQQTDVFDQLRNAGIEVVVVPVSRHFDNSIKAANVIKSHLPTEDKRIESLNRQIIADSVKLSATLADFDNRPKVLFIYARGAGRLLVAGTNTSASAVIEKSGGQNAIQSFEGFKTMTPESLVEASPEVILMFSSGLASLDGKEGLGQIPGIKQTPAYKNSRIVAMDGHYLTAFGPRAGQAALELAQSIHQQ
ncbi:MAG: ABC transporter substrate-binding protein [Bacteroidota bacterium]